MHSQPLTERIYAEFDATAANYAAAPASWSQRRAALANALSSGLPNARDEGFRYSQLRSLETLKFSAVAANADATRLADVVLPPPLPGFTRLVYVDGRLCSALCASDALALAAETQSQGATSQTSPAATAAVKPSGNSPAARRFGLINAAFSVEPLRLNIAATLAATQLELIFVAATDGKAGASYPRICVQTAAGSNVKIVERHLDAGTLATFTNAYLELALGAGARCSHYRIQSHERKSIHLETIQAALNADARLDMHSLHVGAASSRSTVEVRLGGEAASVAVYAAQVADGSQVQDAQVTVEHAARAVSSVEIYRGIASGRARIAFNGQMHVGVSAPGTSTQQSLRGLLSGPDTECDIRPQLEIYTDDVRASHGATVGKLDDNMMFYLLSRGLDSATAQSLLKWAFMADVINRIDIAPLRRDAQHLLLGQVPGLSGEALA